MMSSIAVIAGGCFWGMEELFRKQPGVVDTRVGYTGGTTQFPKYTDVKTGVTHHAEAIEVVFDEKKTSYLEILKFFFKIHDPTTENRQGNDAGTQYRSAIFFANDEQKKIGQDLIDDLNKSNKWDRPIVTRLEQLDKFYLAEEVHQKYLMKNPSGYTCHFIREN